MFHDLLKDNGLSLERLNNFCAIAEAGSIARVAKGDLAKQSLYSRQIKELEEFFQTELTRRKGRGIELTASGKELARIAREHLQTIGDFKSNCLSNATEYRMGAGNSIFEWLLFPKFRAFQASHPNVGLSFINLQTNQILEGLFDHTLDFGYIRKSKLGSARNLKLHSLGTFGYSLAVPQAWKSQKKAPHTIIAERPLAMVVGGELSQAFDAACKKAGIAYRINFGCGDLIQASRLVEMGAAAAILPNIARQTLKNSSIIPLPFFSYQRELLLAWHPRLVSIRPGKTSSVIDSLKTIRI